MTSFSVMQAHRPPPGAEGLSSLDEGNEAPGTARAFSQQIRPSINRKTPGGVEEDGGSDSGEPKQPPVEPPGERPLGARAARGSFTRQPLELHEDAVAKDAAPERVPEDEGADAGAMRLAEIGASSSRLDLCDRGPREPAPTAGKERLRRGGPAEGDDPFLRVEKAAETRVLHARLICIVQASRACFRLAALGDPHLTSRE